MPTHAQWRCVRHHEAIDAAVKAAEERGMRMQIHADQQYLQEQRKEAAADMRERAVDAADGYAAMNFPLSAGDFRTSNFLSGLVAAIRALPLKGEDEPPDDNDDDNPQTRGDA